jgi:hypothetical protein
MEGCIFDETVWRRVGGVPCVRDEAIAIYTHRCLNNNNLMHSSAPSIQPPKKSIIKMEREICRLMHRTLDQNSFPGSNLPPVLITKRDIPNSRPRALIFDLMGTCCDWFSSIVPALKNSPSHPSLPSSGMPQLAIDWREGFFKEIHYRFSVGEPAEDIDITHRRVLDHLLKERGVDYMLWDDEVRSLLVDHWHSQMGTLYTPFL